MEWSIEKGIDFFSGSENLKYNKDKIKRMDDLKQQVKKNERIIKMNYLRVSNKSKKKTKVNENDNCARDECLT